MAALAKKSFSSITTWRTTLPSDILTERKHLKIDGSVNAPLDIWGLRVKSRFAITTHAITGGRALNFRAADICACAPSASTDITASTVRCLILFKVAQFDNNLNFSQISKLISRRFRAASMGFRLTFLILFLFPSSQHLTSASKSHQQRHLKFPC